MRGLLAGLGVALVALGCADPPPAAPPVANAAPAPARSVRTVRVTAVAGRAERQSGAGAALPLKVGDQLAADDLVRTEEGSATLDVGGRADVTIAGHTQVAIGELTEKLSRVKLRDGRISAVVHAADAKLQVEAVGTSAVASADRGEFSMLSTGSQVSVATRSGQVTLSAHGQSVTIGAGQLSVVQRDLPPSAPAAIPPSLFLKVSAPRALAQRQKQTTLHGNTIPGAVISVNGLRVTADPTGEFTATVALKEGANDLTVESEDVLGRRERAAVPRITVDSRAPAATSKVEW